MVHWCHCSPENTTGRNAIILAASGIGSPDLYYHIVNPDALSIEWERSNVLGYWNCPVTTREKRKRRPDPLKITLDSLEKERRWTKTTSFVYSCWIENPGFGLILVGPGYRMVNNNSMLTRRPKESGLYVKSDLVSCTVAAIWNAVGSHKEKSAALKARMFLPGFT